MARKGNPPARGHEYELLACRYLQRRGFALLEQNYRTPLGEIDLVMQDGEVLVFVEVRYRRASRFGGATESINGRKQARIRASANHYLQARARGEDRPCRFDVIAISGEDGDDIQWLENAFT